MNKAGETILRLRSEKRALEQQIASDHRVKILKKRLHGRNQLIRLRDKKLRQAALLLFKCREIIDDDLENRPARHSLGQLHASIQGWFVGTGP